MNLGDRLEHRRGEVEATRENSARLANVYANYRTTGMGSVEFEKRVDFGLTFIERPFMFYGAVLDLDELGELLDVDGGEAVPSPLVSGYVTDWDQDDRGFYVGAWVGCRVYFPSTDGVPLDTLIRVEHHFTFGAIAMKDVPLDVRD